MTETFVEITGLVASVMNVFMGLSVIDLWCIKMMRSKNVIMHKLAVVIDRLIHY